MKNKSINIQRTQSLLAELIPEALSKLNDKVINSLVITEVDCKKGKYDAKVYFDGSDYSDDELRIIKQKLKKVNGHIKSYCLSVTNWYKCPNFIFVKDDMIKKQNTLENLFAKISSTVKNKDE
jgi:ribosome-binding factor A